MDSGKKCKFHSIDDSGAPHVLAAIQTLLHLPPVLNILHNDAEHRVSCRSLLCFCCSFFKILEASERSSAVDVTFFNLKWKLISAMMRDCQKVAPMEVLAVLISKLRLEFVARKKDWSGDDLYKGAIGEIFQVKRIQQVCCLLCGNFQGSTHTLYTIVDEMSSESIEQNLQKAPAVEQCKSCCSPASATIINFTLPAYLIVHCKIGKCVKPPQLKITVKGTPLQFKTCMVKYRNKSITISMCADGSLRRSEDNKTRIQAIGAFVTSGWLQGAEEISIVYERQLVSFPLKKLTTPLRPDQKLKVIGSPEIQGVDLCGSMPEAPKTRTIGTQTSESYISSSAQTTPKQPPKKSADKVPLISYDICRKSAQFQFFTGLTVQDFEAFHELLGGEDAIRYLKQKYQFGTPVKLMESKISSKDRLFMFLLRLRRGLPYEELGVCFGISDGYAAELCYVLTRHIFLTFQTLAPRLFISAAAQYKNKPQVMRPFKNLRVILDGASFFIESPTNFQMQGNNYSDYKAHTVMLFTIGVSCQGSTIFCSPGFEGHTSDQQALLESDFFMNMIEEGDAVMVDRGYDVTSELLKKGVHVIKPPKKSENGFNQAQEILTKAVAAARIYIEHAIADIKDNRLLQGVIPLTLYPVLPQLVFIAAYMRNFSTKKIGNTKVVVDEGGGKTETKSGVDEGGNK